MNQRQYKKACKNSAKIIGLSSCRNDCGEGVWYVPFKCGGYDEEWDSEDTWPYLVNLFNAEVNTIIDHDGDCGISWVDDKDLIKATPKNVFEWARKETF